MEWEGEKPSLRFDLLAVKCDVNENRANLKPSHVSSSSPTHATVTCQIDGNDAWVAETDVADQWVSVDLGFVQRITGVVIQGCPSTDAWVTKYKVMYSRDNTNWDVIFDPQSRQPKVSEVRDSISRDWNLMTSSRS